MSNSSLVSYTRISPNRTSPRNHAVDRVSVHCFVGQVTAKSGCNAGTFTEYDPDNGASCNYVVGHDGSIGLCVEEKDRSWCTSSRSNDHRAITIETASDTKDPYAVTDAAYAALIELLVDICRRNGKNKLLWFGDKDKSLAYEPQNGEMVMTVHRWFANKACPGNYLYERHGAIAFEVNRRLSETEEEDMVRYKKLKEVPNDCHFRDILNDLMDAGIMAGDGSDPNGNDDVIDVSHDMVRMFVFNYRAGCYDAALKDAGVDPDTYK